MNIRDENFKKLVECFQRHVGNTLFRVSVLDSSKNEKAIRLEFQSKEDIGDIQTVYLNVKFEEHGLDVRWVWDSGKE